jgi:hypothetical protein
MNQRIKNNDVLGTVNRGTPCESGLCSLCRADCQGKCETWLGSLRGRDLLYPRDFGAVTAGSDTGCPEGVAYDSLRIRGGLYGAAGADGKKAGAGDILFTDVSLETSFGTEARKFVCRYPFMTGALGSTFIAARYWDSFAVGCALCGVPIVVGENVVGVDRKSVMKNGRITSAPELERRIDTYLRYHDGSGAIIVQMNVEDARNGVAEYLAEKYADRTIIELKWGQGAKSIGGEIQVRDIAYASFLKERGYLVDPDPSLPEVREAAGAGNVALFARHSRLGYTALERAEQVEEDFHAQVGRLRGLGFRSISLKTGAYGMEALALALKLAGDCDLALLTVDGAGGGTGMSPWDMMEHWGTPAILLHSKVHEYASLRAAHGRRVPPLALGGGLAKPSQIFKALALCAPYARLICMGRAMMIPGFLGANIEGALRPERREAVCGNWDSLPRSVSEIGDSAETIFAGYHSLAARLGKEEMKNIPYGAIAIWTSLDRLGAGLQQLMAGARRFAVGSIARSDIASANRETERETGVPFITGIQDETARQLLLG